MRGFHSFRECIVSVGQISKVFGSSMCRMGGCTILASVTGKIVQQESPVLNPSDLISVDVKYTSQCAPSTELNTPSKQSKCLLVSQHLSDLLTRSIVPESFVAFSPTTLASGKSFPLYVMWDLSLQISILQEDGSLLDVALLAAMMALNDVTLPSLYLTRDPISSSYCASTKVDSSEDCILISKSSSLRFCAFPLSVTFGIASIKDGPQIVVDPSLEEEDGVGMSTFSLIFNVANVSSHSSKSYFGLDFLDEPIFWLILKEGGIPIILSMDGDRNSSEAKTFSNTVVTLQTGQVIDVADPFNSKENAEKERLDQLAKSLHPQPAIVNKETIKIGRERIKAIINAIKNEELEEDESKMDIEK
ncbi:putative 3' exoribonuclease family, domain 1 [Monocercomonoides exilis]|uniref:putative 3' exoribonuclease family, domain 1 n=1 Tax=Monocercomonoides exilis TaxID=2049356 RepID=UPI003559A1B1|nr:putative 3' exoribonuclease family, domain 1 [Monocercomonoides exilis]|eukprot:MONOS_15067.1-p1 / transcript=MONOS_15067.1 / gene=MONOS_15067 / organism=Monocercomonoides_exilis_PA203 / gene_product=unspecified product / transcript_product=unspecified product / location=Mono_scaffold01137:5777-7245(-) / protein_length=360 / sequence_SO=supercontig / SO=protein_coding / is_pseudo=false